CAEIHTGPPGVESAHTSCTRCPLGTGYSCTVTCAKAQPVMSQIKMSFFTVFQRTPVPSLSLDKALPPAGRPRATVAQMIYRIQYSLNGKVLMARISCSCPTPAFRARDSGRHARANSASSLLVHVRGTEARAGRPSQLLHARSIPPSIPVVETAANERL